MSCPTNKVNQVSCVVFKWVTLNSFDKYPLQFSVKEATFSSNSVITGIFVNLT